MTADLFSDISATAIEPEALGPGSVILRRFAAADAERLIKIIDAVIAQAPLRHMQTPGGFTMSAAMTNCGTVGWVSDTSGYRYSSADPLTGQPWPALPERLFRLVTSAAATAGFPDFIPDVCLINRYEPAAKMSLHQDKDERDFSQPIVSVSLGLPMTFLFGGERRKDKAARLLLEHGDVVVWGGPDRLRYHGVIPLKEGSHALLGRCRINLTFRKAT